MSEARDIVAGILKVHGCGLLHPTIEIADRILQALDGEGWAKQLEPGQLSTTETIRLIIQSWIDWSSKECRDSGFEPTDDTYIRRFAPHAVSHSQMAHWIKVIAGIEQQRDALQRQIEALTSDKAVEAAAKADVNLGFVYVPSESKKQDMRRAILAAVEASKDPG